MSHPYCQPPQVVAVGPRGFSIVLDGIPMFLAYCDHPLLADAPASELRRVHRPRRNRLYWPTLGVTLMISDLKEKKAASSSSAPLDDSLAAA